MLGWRRRTAQTAAKRLAQDRDSSNVTDDPAPDATVHSLDILPEPNEHPAGSRPTSTVGGVCRPLGDPPTTAWVILTMGDRADAVAAAARSVAESRDNAVIGVVFNGGDPHGVEAATEIDVVGENLGVPGGRDWAMRRSTEDVVYFLDDDARVVGSWVSTVDAMFGSDPELAVVSFRIVDESGNTARRHVPRRGQSSADRSGDVPTFLGGACAIRRSAYVDVGGYWPELWYGHEELDLSWRLIDAGYRIRYEPEAEVFHPRSDIGRHADGWRLTGRNRVWIARRNLPWPVAIAHTAFWLVVGAKRAPRGDCRRSYLAGWRSGWSDEVEHAPMSWRTVWQLTRLGRPPII